MENMNKKFGILLIGFIFILLLQPMIIAKQTTLISNHDPIIILSNNDFTSENGVIGGSGTENDPFIISDWVIEGDGETDYGIFIENTNVFFIIQNCTIQYFFKEGDFQYGIYLDNVINGRIVNTTLYKDHQGIFMKDSHYIQIQKCTINDISFEHSEGIQCYYSTNITIRNIQCFNKDIGILLLDGAKDIIISETDIYACESGITGYSSQAPINNIIIDKCRINNSHWEGIVFQVGYRDGFGSGQLTITNCEIYNNGPAPPGTEAGFAGIEIYYFMDNLIENCTIYHNGFGINIVECRGTLIRNCSIFQHNHNLMFASHGISFLGGGISNGLLIKPNLIEHCTIYDNEIGIITSTCLLKIHRNLIHNNSYFGLALYTLSILSIQNNNIYSNGWDVEGHGAYAISFAYANMRNNWWGSPQGPGGIGPGDGDTIEKQLSIVRYRPWLTEPVSDAGRQT